MEAMEYMIWGFPPVGGQYPIRDGEGNIRTFPRLIDAQSFALYLNRMALSDGDSTEYVTLPNDPPLE